MGKLARRGAIALVVLLLAIQGVPVERSNPPVEQEVPASAEARAVLRRACYDCHSNETVWPWYSRLAPVSWLLVYDVREGRGELNFSTWNRVKPKKRRALLEEAREKVEEREMPPWIYLPAHPEARLSDADRAILREWSREARKLARLP